MGSFSWRFVEYKEQNGFVIAFFFLAGAAYNVVFPRLNITYCLKTAVRDLTSWTAVPAGSWRQYRRYVLCRKGCCRPENPGAVNHSRDAGFISMNSISMGAGLRFFAERVSSESQRVSSAWR